RLERRHELLEELVVWELHDLDLDSGLLLVEGSDGLKGRVLVTLDRRDGQLRGLFPAGRCGRLTGSDEESRGHQRGSPPCSSHCPPPVSMGVAKTELSASRSPPLRVLPGAVAVGLLRSPHRTLRQ